MVDEGYTKYECIWHPSTALEDRLIADLNRWRNRLYVLGLVGHDPTLGVSFGNLSIRAEEEGHFIITGHQTGHIRNTDASHYSVVTACDIDANRVSCRGPIKASSEAMTHAAIYRLDPSTRGIVHVHSSALWTKWKDRIPTTSADVPYGTPEMAWEVERLFTRTDFADLGVAVMGGHIEGLVACGDSISRASERILRLSDGHSVEDLKDGDTPNAGG